MDDLLVTKLGTCSFLKWWESECKQCFEDSVSKHPPNDSAAPFSSPFRTEQISLRESLFSSTALVNYPLI